MKAFLRLILSGLALSLAFLAPAFDSLAEETAVKFEVIALPAGTDVKTVQQAVASALGGRRWSIQEQSSNKVVGYLKHRSNEAEVTFLFDEKQIEISCWGYRINKAGERQEPELPDGWLGILSRDIKKNLGIVRSKNKQ
ncbi:MAG: hypothetical protein WC378_17680 [Opitutaceae bacterium]|jgi:hypothetical protein